MSQSPVTEGEFSTGPELMLWRPGLNRRRLRWRATLRSLLRTFAAAAIVGIGLAALATREVSGPLVWSLIIFAIVLTGISAVGTVVNFRCADYDHQHRPCPLESTPGEFFYRTGDFRDLPLSTMDAVCRVIAAVQRVHRSTAAVWLSAQQLRDVHQVAWGALRLVDRTSTLRDVLTDPRCAKFDELAFVRSYLIETDEAVDRVLTCLLQVELLVTSWERKLAEIDLLAQLRIKLSQVPRETIAATLNRAESVPESVFAYITAARDLTDAGPFDWERPSNRQARRPFESEARS
jgi:hypothetical protein